MDQVNKSLITSTVEIATRTNRPLSMTVAIDDEGNPTHYMVVLPASQIDSVVIPGAEPATVFTDDFS